MHLPPTSTRLRREPAVFAPTALLVLIAAMVALHAWRVLGLGLFAEADLRFLDVTAFVPARFSLWTGMSTLPDVIADLPRADPDITALRQYLFRLFVAGGEAAPWTVVTYAFLHASWEHVIFNGLWLLAFGAPVMTRFGLLRFAMFFVVTAVAAALTHGLVNQTDVAVLVGASGAVSGLTAAALRFAIGPHGLVGRGDGGGGGVFEPARPLRTALQQPSVLTFIAVWFGLNLMAGIGLPLGAGGDIKIAWEAHLGGFVAGLLLFSLFDPVKQRSDG